MSENCSSFGGLPDVIERAATRLREELHLIKVNTTWTLCFAVTNAYLME